MHDVPPQVSQERRIAALEEQVAALRKDGEDHRKAASLVFYALIERLDLISLEARLADQTRGPRLWDLLRRYFPGVA